MRKIPTWDEYATRFWSYVDIRTVDECWYWSGCVNRGGYGRMSLGGVEGRVYHSNQLAYMFTFGKYSKDLCILHSQTCIHNAERDFGDGKRSRLCCNPNHLRLGTVKENSQDTKELGRLKGTFQKGVIMFYGESHYLSKLSSKEVQQIKDDPRKQKIIADEYGVNQSHISRIKSNQSRRIA
jgi:hypothetical protein